MAYLEIPPPPALRAALVCFWAIDPEAGPPAAPERRVYPDGCFDLVFDLEQGGCAAGAAAVGPMTRPILVPRGTRPHFGIRLRPGPASRLFGPPLAELRDAQLAAETLLGRGVTELGERLAAATTPTDRARLAGEFLVRRLALLDPDPLLSRRLQMALAAARDGARVGDLAARIGITARQLERSFLRDVGLRPKEILRLARFRKALERIRSRTVASLARLAQELGYADQAHLTREFARFAGQAPSALLKTGPSQGPWESDLFKSRDGLGPILNP